MNSIFTPKFNGLILKEDVDNIELASIPIRNGCSGGPCACSGYCTRVIAYITREEYNKWKSRVDLAKVLWDMTDIKIEKSIDND